MIDDNKYAVNFDDEILSKLDTLLNKHQNNIASIGNTTLPDLALNQANEALEGIEEENINGDIPTLTEVVILYSSPLRKILDAALEEVDIDMSITDRRILTRAIQQRLATSD